MDLNLALIAGRIAVPAMIDTGSDGERVLRMLVLVRAERRRRIDVIPVRMTDPDIEVDRLTAGRRVFVAGSLIRRCRPGWPGTGARIEVAADSIEIPSHGPGPATE